VSQAEHMVQSHDGLPTKKAHKRLHAAASNNYACSLQQFHLTVCLSEKNNISKLRAINYQILQHSFKMALKTCPFTDL